MRLISTSNCILQSFFNKRTPPYAILSHRWLEDELDFQDVSSGNLNKGPSWAKLQNATKEARQRGHAWLWIDTCCINKDSSAELSEAINSMYKWYQGAEECLAYLHDVHKVESGNRGGKSALQNSEWFYRGWTLQELLAPSKVHFYDRDWQHIGERSQLAKEISSITGIRQSRLSQQDYQSCSVAEMMSWAAKRVTTRPEDQAYCLLGIFDVNMPLLYGEGSKAFIRLQEAIIKDGDDTSIFAWHMNSQDFSGLLAPGPASFDGCGNITCDIIPYGSDFTAAEAAPFSMTNRGLSIELEITPWSTDVYMAYLECGLERRDPETAEVEAVLPVFIFLKRLPGTNQYVRFRRRNNGLRVEKLWTHWQSQRPYKRRRLFIRQKINAAEVKELAEEKAHGFRLPRQASHEELTLFPRSGPGEPRQISSNPLVGENHVLACQYNDKLLTVDNGGWGIVAVVDVSSKLQSIDVIILGFDFDFNPACVLQNTRLNLERRDDVSQQITSSDFVNGELEWAADEYYSKHLIMDETNDRLAMRGTKRKNGFTATVEFATGHPPMFLAMEFERGHSQKWTLYVSTGREGEPDLTGLSRSEWTEARGNEYHLQARHRSVESRPTLDCILDSDFEPFTLKWS